MSKLHVKDEIHIDPVNVGVGNVVSGANGVGMGRDNQATGSSAMAFGNASVATATGSLVVGRSGNVSGVNALGLGYSVVASAHESAALGYRAVARVQKTVNVGGAIIQRKDDGEAAGDALHSFPGVEVVLMSKEVDLKVVADQTLTLASGCHFFADEVGLLITSANTVSGQPTIRAGWTGTLAGLLAAVQTTGLDAGHDRQRFASMLDSGGKTSLTAGVTVAATATTLLGRFYWKGLLVEDE